MARQKTRNFSKIWQGGTPNWALILMQWADSCRYAVKCQVCVDLGSIADYNTGLKAHPRRFRSTQPDEVFVMTQDKQSMSPEQLERDADSRVDMWCSLGLVMLAWAAAIYWLAGL